MLLKCQNQNSNVERLSIYCLFLSISRPGLLLTESQQLLFPMQQRNEEYQLLFMECYYVPGILYSSYPILSFKQSCEVVSHSTKKETQISGRYSNLPKVTQIIEQQMPILAVRILTRPLTPNIFNHYGQLSYSYLSAGKSIFFMVYLSFKRKINSIPKAQCKNLHFRYQHL